MKNNIYKILFGIIILVAIFFRFYNLSSAPPSPTVDEVSIGYNAYSILKTGADEYGTKFPILLRAYDDWRPALYVYLVIPFVNFFGLSVVAVRLPSVILSVLTVIAVYFLIRELTRGSPKIKIGPPAGGFELDIPLVAMALFAISPWDIYICRLGHEVNASFSFLIFGITFFFLYLNKVFKKMNGLNLILSSVFFALSFAACQSTKIVVPLVVLVLAALYFKEVLKDKKTFVIALILGLIIALPIFVSSFDKNALIRFSGTNLLSNSQGYFDTANARIHRETISGDTLGRVFDNNKVAAVRLLSHAYLSHLDPVWLAINEGGEQFKAPTIGLLYLFELPLILLGLLYLARSGIQSKNIIFIIFWAGIAIIPGAITNGYAHPMRVLSILPIPQILAAIGFIFLITFIKNQAVRLTAVILSGILFIIFSTWFAHSYFVLMPHELSKHFQYGVLDALSAASKIEDKYKRVVVANGNTLFESYMFYLYLHKIDPATYQFSGGTRSGGYAEEHKIGKYEFVNDIGEIKYDTLYIINPAEYKKSMIVVKSIHYLDGTPSLLMVEKLLRANTPNAKSVKMIQP